jgi:hypothetical protein
MTFALILFRAFPCAEQSYGNLNDSTLMTFIPFPPGNLRRGYLVRQRLASIHGRSEASGDRHPAYGGDLYYNADCVEVCIGNASRPTDAPSTLCEDQNQKLREGIYFQLVRLVAPKPPSYISLGLLTQARLYQKSPPHITPRVSGACSHGSVPPWRDKMVLIASHNCSVPQYPRH